MYIILVTIANWTYAKEDFYEIIKFMPIQETFNTTYDFEYIMKDDPLAHIYNSTESHTYTIQLNDII